MKKIKHLATIGCSHSSDMFGKPWPIFLKQHLDCDHTMSFSAGAGNELNIEKVKFLVDQNPDLLIVQLTEPGRFTMALRHRYKMDWPIGAETKEYLIGSHHYNGQVYYTFNAHENSNNLSRLLGDQPNQFFHHIDDFIINHVLLSDYNLYYKIMHTISTMAFLAGQKNVPIVFFSWCVDLQKIIKNIGYSDIFKDLNIIPSYIEEFVIQHNLKPLPAGTFGGGHHGSDNQKIICDQFILPYLKEHNFI